MKVVVSEWKYIHKTNNPSKRSTIILYFIDISQIFWTKLRLPPTLEKIRAICHFDVKNKNAEAADEVDDNSHK